MADFYALLGVKKDATVDEIRRAYRKLAAKLHPDRNPGNAEADRKFKEISQAYGVLSNQESRSKYDRGQVEGQKPPSPPPNYPTAGVMVEVELTAREISQGCDKRVTVSRPRQCPDCRGSGKLNRMMVQRCVLCQGSGCQTCAWTGRVESNLCARCWSSGADKELTDIVVRVPPGVNPHGRQKLVGNGDLWGLKGPFYIFANIKFRNQKPGMILR